MEKQHASALKWKNKVIDNGVGRRKDSDDEACFADMGFMFEGSKASTLKCFEWRKKQSETESVQLSCCE